MEPSADDDGAPGVLRAAIECAAPLFERLRGEKDAAQRQHDEHVIGILCTLFHQLDGDRRLRLVGKFAEEELRKLHEQLKSRITSKYGKHSFSSAFKWIDADRTHACTGRHGTRRLACTVKRQGGGGRRWRWIH